MSIIVMDLIFGVYYLVLEIKVNGYLVLEIKVKGYFRVEFVLNKCT